MVRPTPFSSNDTPWQKKKRGRDSERHKQQPRSPLRIKQTSASPVRPVKTPKSEEPKSEERRRSPRKPVSAKTEASTSKANDGNGRETATIDNDVPETRKSPRKSPKTGDDNSPKAKKPRSTADEPVTPLRHSPRKAPKSTNEEADNTVITLLEKSITETLLSPSQVSPSRSPGQPTETIQKIATPRTPTEVTSPLRRSPRKIKKTKIVPEQIENASEPTSSPSQSEDPVQDEEVPEDHVQAPSVVAEAGTTPQSPTEVMSPVRRSPRKPMKTETVPAPIENIAGPTTTAPYSKDLSSSLRSMQLAQASLIKVVSPRSPKEATSPLRRSSRNIKETEVTEHMENSARPTISPSQSEDQYQEIQEDNIRQPSVVADANPNEEIVPPPSQPKMTRLRKSPRKTKKAEALTERFEISARATRSPSQSEEEVVEPAVIPPPSQTVARTTKNHVEPESEDSSTAWKKRLQSIAANAVANSQVYAQFMQGRRNGLFRPLPLSKTADHIFIIPATRTKDDTNIQSNDGTNIQSKDDTNIQSNDHTNIQANDDTNIHSNNDTNMQSKDVTNIRVTRASTRSTSSRSKDECGSSTTTSSSTRETTLEVVRSRTPDFILRRRIERLNRPLNMFDFTKDFMAMLSTTEITAVRQYLYAMFSLGDVGKLNPKHVVFYDIGQQHGCMESFLEARRRILIHPKGTLIHRDISNGLEKEPILVYDNTGNEGNIVHDKYKYILSNDTSNIKSTSPEGMLHIKCDCTDGCGPQCSCVQNSIKHGRSFIAMKQFLLVNENTDCYNSACFACGPDCGCKGNCTNAAPESATNPKLELFRRDENLGMGVRTKELVLPGEILFEFVGVLTYKKCNTAYAWALFDPQDDQVGYTHVLNGVFGFKNIKEEDLPPAEESDEVSEDEDEEKARKDRKDRDTAILKRNWPARAYVIGSDDDPEVVRQRRKDEKEEKEKKKPKNEKEQNKNKLNDEEQLYGKTGSSTSQSSSDTGIKKSGQDKAKKLPDMGKEAINIDPFEAGNIGRFVSHSEFANAIPFRLFQNDLRPEKGRLFFIASRALPPGAEVFVDYGGRYTGFEACLCGSLACKDAADIFKASGNGQAFHMLRQHLMDYSLKHFKKHEPLPEVKIPEEIALGLHMKCVALNRQDRNRHTGFSGLIKNFAKMGVESADQNDTGDEGEGIRAADSEVDTDDEDAMTINDE